MRLKDKVAIITGAGIGIGKEAALLFGQEGARVVVSDLVTATGEETARQIQKSGGDALFIKADAAKASDAEGLVSETIKKYGKLDILYNNAGVQGALTQVAETTEENWDRVITNNMKSVFLCSKYAVREMVKRKYGVIINSASIMGLVGLPGNAAYSASKGGVIQFTRAMALEYAASNIRINCICAGWIDTAMNAHLSERIIKWSLKETPLGRLGQPEEVARAALYLASDESSFVTGTTLVIDGGWTAK